MPLTSNSSYHPVLLSFLHHWEQVNAALPTPFILRQGTRAEALLLADDLEASLTRVTAANVATQIAAAEVLLLRDEMRGLLEQWTGIVSVYWESTPWGRLTPNLPPVDAALDKFLRYFRDALRLWALIETEPPPPAAPVPIRIGPGESIGRTEFAAKVEALREASLAWETAGFAADVARARRDVLIKKTRALLMDYTRVLPPRVGADGPLVATMPRLWPAPGHTPDPVTAEAAWLPEPASAHLTWTASEDKMLDHYEVRACSGPKYDREDETLLGTVDAEAERSLDSTRFLETPGAVASYRVYVVLTTGNERGSETVVLQR